MMRQVKTPAIIESIIREIDENISIFSDASIEYGKMGAALLYYYGHKNYGKSEFLEKGELMIEESINLISKISLDNEYKPKYKGDSVAQTLASFGRGMLFIENNFDHQYDFSEYYLYLDDVLHETVKQELERKDYDCFSGSLAGGYYFLNQYKYNKSSYSKNVLNEIVTSIIDNAVIHNEKEIYWPSPSFDNQIYLGLSHGSAMIINFLTKIVEYKISEENEQQVKDTAYKAVSFVMNQKRDQVNGFFSYRFPAPERATETQFSMCYGDLGILYALSNAAKVFKFEEFEDTIKQMLDASAQRKLKHNHTQDASILYGCSGLYHMFNDIYDRRLEDLYHVSSQYWYSKITDYWNSDKESLAGFQFDYEDNQEIHPSAKYSFFWGIAGIGITLMQGQNQKLPAHNELLLTGI
ncbi:lanthionine synthetase LanC family protein [Chryseobacterium sp. W4I1]|uniref:lanthionine synthetase LanC family protein n=1 Tax=Chryseobacterium sp. W4I1 TaxID=3042293 RepID=UPI00277D866B|nr:lanthionine synthetase LanC family protein [Chryseobacterium sp. W4I1]MDQ0782465.1 hypothetical protein [Chryseobacterium sp. W4I1]